MYRHVFLLAGVEEWQKNTLNEILLRHEKETLWLGENAPGIFPSDSIQKAQRWLGQEKHVVVFDANKKFDPDSFAAISGIIVGGGLFIILMPPEKKWDNVYASPFGQRLINNIRFSSFINIIRQDDEDGSLNLENNNVKEKQHCDDPFITVDQQLAVNSIEQEINNSTQSPVVLVADRGRGKSAALGIAAARLVKKGIKNIVITAPSLRSANVVFKHAEQLLQNIEVKQGKIISNDSIIQFYPPDKLQQENINADVLLVDEAAAIPVPLLTLFLNKFTQCVFSTTVHGYEGTGRGFAVRFNKILNEYKYPSKRLQMKTPVRWGKDDPLEQWMFSLLCLDAEISDKAIIGEVDNDKLDISVVDKSQFENDEKLLKEVFALLVLAHYRTQPGDLQRLLDDNDLSLFIAKYNQHVVAIALVSHEGSFSSELSTAVYRGERRPAGNLLAQALTYHCGVEDAATLSYARIMRIAVHPELQGQGIGTKLLEYISQHEKENGCDAIGSSFGLNLILLKFWRAASFNTVRIGFKREQTSGEHAAIMLNPLSDKGETVYHLAHQRFIQQCPYLFDDVLKDLSEKIKRYFKSEFVNCDRLTDADNQDLYSFLNYTRNYELCIAAINKLVRMKQQQISEDTFPEDFKIILSEKIFNKSGWKQIAVLMKLNGQKDARLLLKQAVNYLMQ